MLNAADGPFLQQFPAPLLRPVARDDLADPRGRWQGQGAAVAVPRNAEEVAHIVRLCGQARVGVVPLGGKTGLVGGQLSLEGPLPLLLSLEKMTKTRGLYPFEQVIEVEAGTVLADVQAQAEQAGRLFPLTLASQGSAQIGGLLATNAGGVNVLRYGNARDLCLGIEAVLADGRIFHGLKRLRKDNTGYDLRHLIIGSEGSLGIITAASLRLFPRPAAQVAGLFVVHHPMAALELLARAQDRFAGMITAFELISGQGLLFLRETMPHIRQPFDHVPPWMVLVDLGLPPCIDGQTALMQLYETSLDLVPDGIIAQSGGQRADFWALREAIPFANRKIGAISSHDIAVPASLIQDFITVAQQKLAGLGDFRINCFGHLGDGNLHFNVFPPFGADKTACPHLRPQVQRLVHDLVQDYGGSFSAEHGVGRLKADDLQLYGDPAKLAAMRAIKTALDPCGILNPGAVLRGLP